MCEGLFGGMFGGAIGEFGSEEERVCFLSCVCWGGVFGKELKRVFFEPLAFLLFVFLLSLHRGFELFPHIFLIIFIVPLG